MQIKMTNNNANMYTMANSLSGNKPQLASVNQGTGSIFGPQCKVTISQEGKRLSEESKQPSVQSAQAGQVERLMLRQQKQSEDYKDEYAKIIDEINSIKNSINSVEAAADQDTIEQKQEALRKMEELKERQDEENEKRLKEATGNIAGFSKQQEQINRNREELYIMLKSFEEREEGKDTGSHSVDDESSESDGAGGIAEEIQKSASMLGVSAARREMRTTGIIDELENDGLSLISQVNSMMNDIYGMLDEAEQAMDDDTLSDEEKMRLVSEAGDRAKAAAQANYGDMVKMQAKGLQERQDARELRFKHIVINPLDGAANVQREIMNVSVDAAFSELAQGILDDTSQELADRVQKEIDKQNNVAESKEDDTEELEQEELEKEELEKEEVEKEEAKKEELEKSDFDWNQTESEIMESGN